MTLEKAEKMPTGMFERLPDSEAIADGSQGSPAQGGASVLDIGVKAENTPFLNGGDGANVRNMSQGASPSNTSQNASNVWQPTQGTSAKLGDSLSGKTATEILNFLFPAICAYLVDALGYRFSKQMIELTPDEKKVVAQALQDYMNTVNVSFNNPLYTLLFVLGGVYAGKFIEVIPNLQKKPQGLKNTAQIATTGTGARVAATTVVESLIAKTIKTRKKGRNDAINFLLKQGEIKQVQKGVFALA